MHQRFQNLSMHGEDARATLIRHGSVDSIATAVSSLAQLSREDDSDGSSAAAIELLLGCLGNLSEHHPDLLLKSDAVSSALKVLQHTPAGHGANEAGSVHEAAAHVIRSVAIASTESAPAGAQAVFEAKAAAGRWRHHSSQHHTTPEPARQGSELHIDLPDELARECTLSHLSAGNALAESNRLTLL